MLFLVSGYMVAEFVGGLLTNSLALLADAGHMLSDVAALALSLFAIWLTERPPTARRTYGYYRAEILAALANGGGLIAIAIFILREAYLRLREPPQVMGAPMLAIAAGGLLVNATSLWLLRGGREESLNVRGAWLHAFTDALGSVGAILAGAMVWAFGWHWADPAVSALIGILVIYSAWHLVADAASVLMEGAPSAIDVDDVARAMQETQGVATVHDLHVWSITSGLVSLSAHAVVAARHSPATVLKELQRMLRERFGIDHITIQTEPEDFEREPPGA
jgi:cobalt-zinc-cadmium efflux system protein